MTSLNLLSEEDVSAWRKRLFAALLQLRDGSVPLLDGVRKVLAVANEPRERDRDFDLFAAIDSETDHLPPAHTREHCAIEWLEKCDEEASQVETFYREAVNAQVEHLLAKYSLSADGTPQVP